MRKLGMVMVLGALAVAPAQATGAETVGETFVPSVLCQHSATFIQAQSPGGRHQVSADGVITSWSFHAAANPAPMKLKVARDVGGNSFEIRGETKLESPSPNVLNTFGTRIPARVGDVIGMFLEGISTEHSPCNRIAVMPGFAIRIADGDAPVGAVTEFAAVAPHQMDISAKVEPDADGDGFGDETQDGCPTDASKQGPCFPPQVTITKGAPGVLKKRKVTFRFQASEPGSTFECALKGKAARKKLRRFKPCTSPKRYKRLRNGKHTFKVRATDPAGNTGKPATDRFRVVPKKTRRR